MTPPGLGNRLVDARSGRETVWSDLPELELTPPVAVTVDSSFDALPAVLAHAGTGAELLVVAATRLEQLLRAELAGAGFAIVAPDGTVDPSPAPRAAEVDRLWLLTSGSTGRPKRIGHTLASLTTVGGNLEPRTWLCPYSPGTYAWWQVITLGLGFPGQDLVVVDPADLESWVSVAATHRVTAASGTPTFWRRTLMSHGDALAAVPLRQISLGGEPVDQAILDDLRSAFPEARISWLYASSEVGASIVVHDGRAGFPVEWLGRVDPGRPTVEVEDGELVITSPHHGVGLDGPVRTGDAVTIEAGRVLIVGRVDKDEINVGGSKVSAGVVRDVLQSHPAVAWARVRGRRAPIGGNLVAADVVVDASVGETSDVVAELRTWCAERLPEYGVPRFIKVLDEIPAKETLKSDV